MEEIGHMEKVKLDGVMQKTRKETILKQKRIKVLVGAGKYEKMNIDDLTKRFEENEIWRSIHQGSCHPVPILEQNLKSKAHPVLDTENRMKDKLCNYFKELQEKAGLSATEAEDLLKGDKVKDKDKDRIEENGFDVKNLQSLYKRYQNFMSIKCEVLIKEAIVDLGFPGLVIRSLDKEEVIRKYRNLLVESGLQLARGGKELRDEFDVVGIFPDGDGIRVLLVEIKQNNIYPWDTQPFPPPPGRSLVEGKWKNDKYKPGGSWYQLSKGYTFITDLLCDVPPEKLSVNVFSAFPKTPRHVLEKVFWCDTCLPFVLGEEDLDPKELKSRLIMLGFSTAPPTPEAFSVLLKACSRMVGMSSLLHLGKREPGQALSARKERLSEEREQVEEEVFALLSQNQEKALTQMIEKIQAWHEDEEEDEEREEDEDHTKYEYFPSCFSALAPET